MSLPIEEKLAIHELLARCSAGLDRHDLAMLEACYVEESVFALAITGADPIPPFEGMEAILGLYSGAMETQTDVRKHVVSNIYFEEEGEEPVVFSTLTLFATENGETKLLTAGEYRDVVRKTDAGWRLLHRQLQLDRAY